MRKRSALMWYTILLVLTSILALAVPPEPNTLHLIPISTTAYRLIVFTLLLPSALIGFTAFYAYTKLRTYAHHLETTREGKAYKKISTGVAVLAWGLILPTFLFLVFGTIVHYHPSFSPIRTILNNYAALLVPLIGFTFIGDGSRLLTETVRSRPTLLGVRLFAALFILVSVFFSYFVIHVHNQGNNPYHLPLSLLVVTIIIPYLYAWFIGLLSAYELYIYAKKIKGVWYRQALMQLYCGVATVILASIAVQYLNNVFANKSQISVASLLAVLFSLVVVQGLGYALIALGASRLKKIEEV